MNTVFKHKDYTVLIGRVPERGHYIGRNPRYGFTALGNPFHISNHRDRDQVCDLYKEWFKYNHSKRAMSLYLAQLEQELREKRSLTLVCHCAPKRCHGETIAMHLLYKMVDT